MVYIIIVSHGHEDYIKKLLENLNADDEHYKIIVRDNKDSLLLKQICQHYAGLDYISGGVYGFGHNNNIAVAYVKEKYRPADDDYILFLNPDIIMKHDDLLTYIKYVESKRYAFSTLCLFRDEAKSLHDYSVRKFPVLSDFIVSFMLGINKTKIPKESIYSDTVVDWCAGSFMLVRFSDFVRVNGFDQGYFMYCEDIDLCLRLS
ncbi:glycosyltransferase family 2 protein, partial [Escherichia coli]|nr:glycosyltransferase family 2 protein [Escherichia coli]